MFGEKRDRVDRNWSSSGRNACQSCSGGKDVKPLMIPFAPLANKESEIDSLSI